MSTTDTTDTTDRTDREALARVAEHFAGEPAGEIAALWLQSLEDREVSNS